ncbi:hypothetical protein ACMFMF_006462 [Clarireedia jacksonii]
MTLALEIRRSLKVLRALLSRKQDELNSTYQANSLPVRFMEVLLRTWDLGLTAFGGPPVHFQIIYNRFVEGKGGSKWIDEQTQLVPRIVCCLPGAARTGKHQNVVLLPGAVAMYGLSLGVQRMDEVLPSPVYALLSGLNASTVGIIALAAVQLAEKAIKDDITRILVIFGACAGVCYNALWYFPVLMIIGGLATFLWDGHLKRYLYRFKACRRRGSAFNGSAEDTAEGNAITLEENSAQPDLIHRRITASSSRQPLEAQLDTRAESSAHVLPHATHQKAYTIRIRVGIPIVIAFFVILVRALLRSLPLGFSLFANMYLAGTIIFGGGPVVIPLLRSYVVDPGWVSSRDFLLGLAIIQALPGPNFNFTVYLGALTLQRTQYPTVLGSLIAFIGIFFPGLALAVAVQGFWRVMRVKQWVLNVLRGVNATAVGLVFTAVYRLWEIGYLTPKVSSGQSLALNPWWVVVTTVTYAESAWFKVPPPLAILIGAVLGLCWYGTVGK